MYILKYLLYFTLYTFSSPSLNIPVNLSEWAYNKVFASHLFETNLGSWFATWAQIETVKNHINSSAKCTIRECQRAQVHAGMIWNRYPHVYFQHVESLPPKNPVRLWLILKKTGSWTCKIRNSTAFWKYAHRQPEAFTSIDAFKDVFVSSAIRQQVLNWPKKQNMKKTCQVTPERTTLTLIL